MVDVIRQAWQIEKARLLFYWHHPWVIVIGVLGGIVIYLAMLGGFALFYHSLIDEGKP